MSVVTDSARFDWSRSSMSRAYIAINPNTAKCSTLCVCEPAHFARFSLEKVPLEKAFLSEQVRAGRDRKLFPFKFPHFRLFSNWNPNPWKTNCRHSFLLCRCLSLVTLFWFRLHWRIFSYPSCSCHFFSSWSFESVKSLRKFENSLPSIVIQFVSSLSCSLICKCVHFIEIWFSIFIYNRNLQILFTVFKPQSWLNNFHPQLSASFRLTRPPHCQCEVEKAKEMNKPTTASSPPFAS